MLRRLPTPLSRAKPRGSSIHPIFFLPLRSRFFHLSIVYPVFWITWWLNPTDMLSHDSSDFDLTIRQQPERARVAGGKEKGMSFAARFLLSPESTPSSTVLVGAVRVVAWAQTRRVRD